MSTALEIFITRSIGYARTLPLAEATVYLRGMLELGGDCPELASIRSIYNQLSASDDQLELIGSGQLKLEFIPTNSRAI